MLAIANDSQSSFYKPNIAPSSKQSARPPAKPSAPAQPAPDWRTQGKKKASLSKPNLQGNQTPKADNSRLDAIYAQLKELNSFKNEIMNELEDFDVSSHVTVPEQFEEVVDMVVDDERQKGAEKLQGSGEKEKRVVLPGQIEEKDSDKPFWAQFLKSEYDAKP